MATNRPFLVDGAAIPTPSTYKVNIEDLSSEASGRTLDGVMHKDVVAVKKYIECTWPKLNWTDAAALFNAIDGKSKVSFTHADPRVPDRYVTGAFYIGKRSGAALDLSHKARNWTDISLTFTEI